MKKYALISLILMVIISCGTNSKKKSDDLSESEKTEQVIGEFKNLYSKLLNFKNTSDFINNGFASNSLNEKWLKAVRNLQENPDSEFIKTKGINVSDLEKLGLAYATSKGLETEETIKIKNDFDKTFPTKFLKNNASKLDSTSSIATKPLSELITQFPRERLLFPEGIKENPITHPLNESYVDSLVNPNSITGLNRVYSYVSEPTYMVFPANKEKNKKIGLIIYPGGGLRNIWLDKEGTDIAKWLSKQGITCMVVKYRTNRRQDGHGFEIDMDIYNDALDQDSRKSIQTMKNLADSLNFDKEKIGVMGFSAGGYVAQLQTYRAQNQKLESTPYFAAWIYINDFIERFEEANEPDKLPPLFLAAASNDYRLNIKKQIDYLGKLSVTAKNSELHIYRDGGHGFGLGYNENGSVKNWKYAFINWIDTME